MADMTVDEALAHADDVAKRHDLNNDSAYDLRMLLVLAAEVRRQDALLRECRPFIESEAKQGVWEDVARALLAKLPGEA